VPSPAGSSGAAGSGSTGASPTTTTSSPNSTVTVTLAPVALISSVHASGHAVRFVLGSSGTAKSFECALVRGTHVGRRHLHYAACGSVRVYRHLPSGRYTFFARALGPGGVHRAPARRSFLIR